MRLAAREGGRCVTRCGKTRATDFPTELQSSCVGLGCNTSRAARFFGVYVRAPGLISRFRAPECAQSRVLRVGDCSGGVKTQASNTWIDLHTRTSVQRTHPPHNNTHSTQRKLARGAVLRCEPTRAMLGHAFTLCSSAICRQSPACSCTATGTRSSHITALTDLDLHLCRR
jgi:hypothetical protein